MAWKVRFSRALAYMNYVNTCLIIFITLKGKEIFGYNIDSLFLIIPIFIIMFLVLLLIGWLEDHFGFHRAEQDYNQTRNDRLLKMEKILEELKTHINRK